MNVGYYPIDNWSNRYISISQECIRKCRNELVEFDADKPENIDKIDCLILNWYESLDPGSISTILEQIRIKKAQIESCKSRGVWIILTFHNKEPHDLNSLWERFLSLRFYRWLIKKSDRIIVLSDDTRRYLHKYISKKEIRKKCFLNPHPNYLFYDDKPLAENEVEADNSLKFELLFIGRIRPYKNLEVLIDAVKELDGLPIYLKIAGLPTYNDYAESIKKRIGKTEKITYEFGFVPDESINSYIRNSSIVVLPYDVKSSMNSGTVLLAFSNKRSVICPMISTLSDFDDSLFYAYTYKRYEDHKCQLKNAIERAYNDWLKDRKAFDEKGRQLYSCVRTRNSVECITERYRMLFKQLINSEA